MPIYEYRCESCRARFTVLARTVNAAPPRCSTCGETRIARLMSRFAAPKSEEARLDALADPSTLGDVDEENPRSVARWMKRLSRETGEDMGDGFAEEIERAVEEASGTGGPGAEHLPGASDAGASDE